MRGIAHCQSFIFEDAGTGCCKTQTLSTTGEDSLHDQRMFCYRFVLP